MANAEQSFEELALPHLPVVYRVARRLCRDDHAAEDLVQDTYLMAYRAFANFEMREFGIRPWLLKILNNTFLNRNAREKRAPRAVDQQSLDQIHGDETWVRPPDLDFEAVDEEIKLAIDGLAPEFRTVLLLWASNEMSYQEIADTLGLPIGTVMSRLYRARRQLVETLDEYARRNRIAGARSKR